MSNAIVVRNLWKSYSAGVRGCSARVWVLRGCSLLVQQGERVGVVGARASGKSTLLQCLAGDRRPDAGHVEVAASIRRPPLGISGPEVFSGRRTPNELWLLDDDEHAFLHTCVAGSLIVFTGDAARVSSGVDRLLLLRDGHLTPITRLVARRVAERVAAPAR